MNALLPEFDSVKNFALDIDGMRETVKDREACEVKCLEREPCCTHPAPPDWYHSRCRRLVPLL